MLRFNQLIAQMISNIRLKFYKSFVKDIPKVEIKKQASSHSIIKSAEEFKLLQLNKQKIKFVGLKISNNFYAEQKSFKDQVSLYKIYYPTHHSIDFKLFLPYYGMMTTALLADEYIGNANYICTLLTSLGSLIAFARIYKIIDQPCTITVNPTQKKAFCQFEFNRAIIKSFPQMDFKSSGKCYGHVNLWYQFHLKNQDYLKALDEIQFACGNYQELTLQQFAVLREIVNLQNGNSVTFSNNNTMQYTLPMHFIRKRLVDLVVENAIKKPNKLFVLAPYNNFSKKIESHVIGLVSEKGGKIKFFDPEYGEYAFKDALSAKISLSRLLAYKYTRHMPHLSEFFRGKNKKLIEPLSLTPATKGVSLRHF